MIARLGFRGRVLLGSLLTGACATTGATFQSGVGETMIEHPPYYAGARTPVAGSTLRPGHLPITYQHAAEQQAMFDPNTSRAMIALLDQMNAFLDSLDVSVPLFDGTRPPGTDETVGVPPDVQFGCTLDPGLEDECVERGDSVLGRSGQRMRLAVGRPSAGWIAWMAEVMDERGVNQALVVTLEVGQYLIRQRGLIGAKEIELGTGYVGRFPWLTSLEKPVSVIQLTGALMGRDGKAVRIGAEGLLARRTSLPVSSLGFQALIREEDVAALLTERRNDLPNAPLVWQASLQSLVRQLVASTATR